MKKQRGVKVIDFHKKANKDTETLSFIEALGGGSPLVGCRKLPKQGNGQQRWELMFKDGTTKNVPEAALTNRNALGAMV